jgi:hypothetical protein
METIRKLAAVLSALIANSAVEAAGIYQPDAFAALTK